MLPGQIVEFLPSRSHAADEINKVASEAIEQHASAEAAMTSGSAAEQQGGQAMAPRKCCILRFVELISILQQVATTLSVPRAESVTDARRLLQVRSLLASRVLVFSLVVRIVDFASCEVPSTVTRQTSSRPYGSIQGSNRAVPIFPWSAN